VSTANPARPESSHLGKSFKFKGDIAGSEDIYIDGEVEGTILLPNQIVTVGPNGQVNADIQARELLVQGKVKGNAKAQDRIEVTRTGSVLGDLSMARISIQDGAFIQGRIDIRTAGAAAAASVSPSAVTAAAAPAASAAPVRPQGSLLDRRA
jgi:cytoskeletal protein CcmA (bactofilin family)